MTGFFYFIRIRRINHAGLLSSGDIEKDHDLFVPQIDCIDKSIDQLQPEIEIEEISAGECFHPGDHLILRDEDLLLDPELRKLRLRTDPLILQLLHALSDPGDGAVRHGGQTVNKAIELLIETAEELLKIVCPGMINLRIIDPDNGGGDLMEPLRIENILDSLLADIPFEKIFLFPAFPTIILSVLSAGTGIIIVFLSGFRGRAVSTHRKSALPAEEFSLQQERNRAPASGRLAFVLFPALHGLGEDLRIYDRSGASGKDLSFIHIFSNVCSIRNHRIKRACGESGASESTISAGIEIIRNIRERFSGGISLIDLPDNGSRPIIRDKMMIPDGISIRNRSAAEPSFFDGLRLSSFDVFRQIRGIVFRHRLKKPLQDDSFRRIGDIFHHRDNADTILSECPFIDGRVISVPGEAIQLPDDHNLELLFCGIADHALEVRTII